MAHNLYQNRMAFTGEIPWHQLGTHFQERFTSEQAIAASGLDYTVEKERLFRKDGTEVGAFATVNTANNEVLGIVGNKYEIVQPRDSFGFFDALVEEGAAVYETAGALGFGEKLWLLAKLPITFVPLVGDKVESYCLLYNSFDGTQPCSVAFTPIRVVCQNTLNLALHDKSLHQIVKIKHTSSATERLKTAGAILREMNEYFAAMGKQCELFANFLIDDDFIEEYRQRLFGKEDDFAPGRSRTIRNNKVEMFEHCRKSGLGTHILGVKETAWGLFNAAIEYADYSMPKMGSDPTECVIFGSGADFKQKAYDEIMDLVGVGK